MSCKLQEEHLETFIDFMENHKEFATGRLSIANSREKFRELWKDLAQKLNALGHGIRPIEKWQKVS